MFDKDLNTTQIADQKASINLLVSIVITHLKKLKNTGKTLNNKSSKEKRLQKKKMINYGTIPWFSI